MKQRLLSILLLCTLLIGTAYAQDRTIRGTVTSAEDGSTLPGVSVTVQGSSVGTQTNADGVYTLSVPADARALVFSYIGFTSQTVNIGSNTTVDVSLQTDAQTLEDVVVTAYGAQTKESIAGSISTLRAGEIAQAQTANVIQSLAGKVGGVQIRSTSGQPGASSTVRFRGIGSISSSNQPLYVVDGVPYNGDVAAISPQDIDQISFLKDASANALYGSRGANGVIIITTKKGRGELDINYESRVGVNSRGAADYNIIKDPKEYYELRWQRLRMGAQISNKNLSLEDAGAIASNTLVNDLGYNIFNVPNDQIVDRITGKINPNASLLYQDNWNDALFSNSVRQEHFLNLRYGTERLSTYMSGSYLKDEGYVVNSGYDRIAARTNLEYKLLDHVKLGTNMNFSSTKSTDPQLGKASGTFSNLFSWTRNMAPIYPVYARDAQGNFVLDQNGNKTYDWGRGETTNPNGTPARRIYITDMNPYATTIENIQTNDNKNFSIRAFASVDFLKDFNFTYNLGYDHISSYRLRYATELGGDARPYGGSITNAASFEGTLTNQQLLTYDKSINDHHVNVMVGHESSDFVSKMMAGNKTNVVIPGRVFLSNASKFGSLNGYNDTYSVEGYLSRVNYNYAQKYFVNASLRRDGSSVFHPDNRWGTFYGVGGAWIASKEDFLNGNETITNLKLKASYGEQGNDYLFYPNYVSMDHRTHFGFGRNFLPYETQYEITSDADGNPSIREVYFGNKDLKWEVSKNFNTGIELSLYNRVNIEAEYFKRAVSDMLYNFPLPPSSGTPSVSRNIGNMQNTGIEIGIDGDVLRSEDLNLNLWVNATHYKNKVTKLPDPFNSGVFRYVEGKSSYTYYLREFAGVDAETGAAKWYVGDVDDITREATGPKTETTTHSAATVYLSDKTAHPDLYGGFGLNMQYKKLSVSVGFAYQLGGYVFDNVYQGLFDEGTGFGSSGHNYHRDIYKTWSPDNTGASLPRVSSVNNTQYGTSDLFLISANYLSLENFAVSYDLNDRFLNSIGIKNARISLLGNNIALWSKRKGMDPRMMQIGGQTNNGLTLNSYSLLRSLSLGINLNF